MNEKPPSEQLREIRKEKKLYEISLTPFASVADYIIDFLHFKYPFSFLIAGKKEAFVAAKIIRYHIAQKLLQVGNTLSIRLKPWRKRQAPPSETLSGIALVDQKCGPVLNPAGPFSWHVLTQTYFFSDHKKQPEGFFAITAQDIQGTYYSPTTESLGEFTLADVLKVWPVDDFTMREIECEWLNYVAIHAAYKPMTHVSQMH